MLDILNIVYFEIPAISNVSGNYISFPIFCKPKKMNAKINT